MYKKLILLFFFGLFSISTSCSLPVSGFVKPVDPSSDKSIVYFLNTNERSISSATTIFIIFDPERIKTMKGYLNSNGDKSIRGFNYSIGDEGWFLVSDAHWDYIYLSKKTKRTFLVISRYSSGHSAQYIYKDIELNIGNDSEYFFDFHLDTKTISLIEKKIPTPDEGKLLINNLKLRHIEH